MWAASSLTQPSSAEPRVCCQGRPRKYSPADSVTPRSMDQLRRGCRRSARRSRSGRGRSRSPRSTVVTARLEPSSKLTVAPSASVVRPWIWMPRRRAARGVEPIRLSRSFIRRPMRESTVLPISPVATRKEKMSRPRRRCGSGIWREPTDRWTAWEPASSSAIWKPVLPPPTTSTDRPGWCRECGSPCCGSWTTSGPSRQRSADARHLEGAGGDHDLVGRSCGRRARRRSRRRPGGRP